jgi:N-acyl-D-amino-acid deacylase
VRDGGRKAFVQRLRTSGIRERLGKEFAQRPLAWKDVLISSLTHEVHSTYPGKNIAELSDSICCEPFELAISLLIEEEGDIPVINFSQSEENVAMVLKLPFSLICTDASARSPEGPLSFGIPHPRAYGTCARLLGHYVREREILALTRALDKITVLPARRLGLKGRGALQKGYHADITVFDPMQIAERSTYLEPHHFPAGIEHVLVNGTCVVTKGTHTGALPGRVLRRQNHKADKWKEGSHGR